MLCAHGCEGVCARLHACLHPQTAGVCLLSCSVSTLPLVVETERTDYMRLHQLQQEATSGHLYLDARKKGSCLTVKSGQVHPSWQQHTLTAVAEHSSEVFFFFLRARWNDFLECEGQKIFRFLFCFVLFCFVFVFFLRVNQILCTTNHGTVERSPLRPESYSGYFLSFTSVSLSN